MFVLSNTGMLELETLQKRREPVRRRTLTVVLIERSLSGSVDHNSGTVLV